MPVPSEEVPVLFTSNAESGVESFALVATTSLGLLTQLPVELVYRLSLILPAVSWKNSLLSPFGSATTETDVSFWSPWGRSVAAADEAAEGGGELQEHVSETQISLLEANIRWAFIPRQPHSQPHPKRNTQDD